MLRTIISSCRTHPSPHPLTLNGKQLSLSATCYFLCFFVCLSLFVCFVMFCSVYLPQPSQLSNLGATLRLGFILMQFLICAFFSTEMFEEKHIALLLLLRTTLIHAKVGQIHLFQVLLHYIFVDICS